MDYLVSQDIQSVIEICGMTLEGFAKELGVSRMTVNNWLSGRNAISEKNTKLFYEYAFGKGIRLNKIKEQFYREDYIRRGDVLLFHGAKTGLSGKLDLEAARKENDFGKGFYCGESLEQSAMFVASYPRSSLYMIRFNGRGLVKREFSVDRDWMLTVALCRGKLKAYEHADVLRGLAENLRGVDYIVAPIADNRMYEIIDSFIDGEITDVQCGHCLSATNLGKQYVFVSTKALGSVELLEKCYLADAEKKYYIESRQENFNINLDKVKLARKQYRNQGEYIEDILK